MTKEPLLIFAERWRSLPGFAILFRILENLFFAPLIAVAIHWLVGRTVLDSTALVSFLLSPRGLLVVMLASVTLSYSGSSSLPGCCLLFTSDWLEQSG